MNVMNTVRVWGPVVYTSIIPENRAENRTTDSGQSCYKLVEAKSLPQPLAPDRRQGLHLLRPRSSHFVLGMIAQTQTRSRILGLTTYFGGGHDGLFQAIQQCFGPVRAVLWGGELVLRNMRSEPGVGMVMQANETSGFLSEPAFVRTERVDNRVENLMGPLQQGDLPLRVSRVVRAIQFDPEHLHLHPGLARMPENFRHNLVGNFMVVADPIEAIIEGKDLTAISSHFRRWIDQFRSIKSFCDLLINCDPAQARNFQELSRLLGKILSGHRLSRDEYEAIPPAMKNLAEFYIERGRENQGNEYDLFNV